jgi:hypothetical protein
VEGWSLAFNRPRLRTFSRSRKGSIDAIKLVVELVELAAGGPWLANLALAGSWRQLGLSQPLVITEYSLLRKRTLATLLTL